MEASRSIWRGRVATMGAERVRSKCLSNRETVKGVRLEGLGPLGLPLLIQGAAAAAGDHVEGRDAHPLEPAPVDHHVERIFDPLMDDATLVDLTQAARRGAD